MTEIVTVRLFLHLNCNLHHRATLSLSVPLSPPRLLTEELISALSLTLRVPYFTRDRVCATEPATFGAKEKRRKENISYETYSDYEKRAEGLAAWRTTEETTEAN